MLNTIQSLSAQIGNTPLVKLQHDQLNLYTKLEYKNLGGSIKARPAFHILKKNIEAGLFDQNTTLIESTSGNLGVAFAILCQKLGLNFIPVIDPNTNAIYEKTLYDLCQTVIKVTEKDATGGYNQTRIKTIENILKDHPSYYWVNQYANPLNAEAHYLTTGEEIARDFDSLDYAFLAVSSAGTISGVSRRLKEKFPNIQIIAVDQEGSAIFNSPVKPKRIPGMGSSIVPALVKEALIDHVMHISESDNITGCYELWQQQGLFAGASTGAVYKAIHFFFSQHKITTRPNIVFLTIDHGESYRQTVYNPEWTKAVIGWENKAA